MQLSDSRYIRPSPQSVRVAVVMERRALANRWQSETWQPVAVVPDEPDAATPRVVLEDGGRVQWLHPGFEIVLHRDEAEGYYLNLTAPEPYMFVMWRMDDGQAVPKLVTPSYHEAARLMDGGAQVDGVPLPAEIAAWLAEYVDANYRPEPKKRARPPSFKGARRDE
jgi:Protein of unknown function (DUF3305)